jgi:ABC-type uncharacterized transport system permease subunit
MVLLMFAVSGALLGYWLGTTRRGYVTMAVVSIGSAAVQIGHLLTSTDRSWMTMLPLVIGTVVVAFMLAGALVRRTPHQPSA